MRRPNDVKVTFLGRERRNGWCDDWSTALQRLLRMYFRALLERREVAGSDLSQRPRPDAGRLASNFRSLGDHESVVVDLDAEIPHSAFELRMAKQQLHGSQTPGSPIDRRRLGTPDQVATENCRFSASSESSPVRA
jgi:hypothetical protein